MHFNKSYILVLFKCFFKVDWNFNLSLNKRKTSNLPDLEFLQHYVELCSDQSIIHLPQPEIAVLWKACKKWGYRMWCCVNTFHSGLLTRQIFVSTLILVFLMFASNKGHLFKINFSLHALVSDSGWYTAKMTLLPFHRFLHRLRNRDLSYFKIIPT